MPVLALVLSLACTLAPSAAQDAKPAAAAPAFAKVRPYNLDFPVDEIRLKDLDGKERALFAESEGKAVVLVFWSYRDPVSRYYAAEIAALQARLAESVSFYLVDSNHDELVINGDAVAKIRDVVKAEKIALPVLLDAGNELADEFDAQNNGQAFAIDANRFLRYKGGVDDDPRGEKKKAQKPVLAHLDVALASILKAEKPAQNWTMAAGRPIKRAPKGAGAKAR
jgi:peroxiredoxin